MKQLLLLLLFPVSLFAQGYTSYFTGNATDATTSPEPGICLMGGATEHDNAMRWLLQKANGGDVVVLRSSGSNGYNDYLYSELGVQVNSVETLVITSIAGATNPYVLNKVANAEMIWFAGGDQYNYVSYFKDNALEDLINTHVNVKHAPIGGTSAGMAILCGRYFSAQNGSITSSAATSNPYNPAVTLGSNDFLTIPFLQNVTTDTHFDNPDRKGRLMAFMGRIATETGTRSFGVAANEYVAICIDENGKASVYGDYPNYEEYAYFVQANCTAEFLPETCSPNQALVWNRGGEALKSYMVPGTMNGTNYFELSDWQTGSGGFWRHWWTTGSGFGFVPGTALNCALSATDFEKATLQIAPVPFDGEVSVSGFENGNVKIYDSSAQLILESEIYGATKLNTSGLASGIYTISVESGKNKTVKKIIKK